MLSLQSKLIQIAQKRQNTFDKRHMQNNTPNSVMQFAPNSFVLVLYPKTAMGSRAPTKLHTHWKGPMRVISNTGADYTVHDLTQDKKHIQNNTPNSVMQFAPNSFVLMLYSKTAMGSRAPTKLHTH